VRIDGRNSRLYSTNNRVDVTPSKYASEVTKEVWPSAVCASFIDTSPGALLGAVSSRTTVLRNNQDNRTERASAMPLAIISGFCGIREIREHLGGGASSYEPAAHPLSITVHATQRAPDELRALKSPLGGFEILRWRLGMQHGYPLSSNPPRATTAMFIAIFGMRRLHLDQVCSMFGEEPLRPTILSPISCGDRVLSPVFTMPIKREQL
jgi:hypothetical protein